jgi:RNA polymerase sigma factor (sigma-70 family)
MGNELTRLMVAARNGDLQAYGQIVGRFQDMAFGCAYSILGDFHQAEDVAQEAFIQAYQKLSDLRKPEAFPGWFHRIVVTQCSREARRKNVETVPLDHVPEMAAVEANPDEAIDEQDMKDKVLEAIRSLPESQRMATTLFYINGYSQNEVADFLEVPVTTVKKRLHDSRAKLKKRMIKMVADTLQENRPNEAFWHTVVERMVDVSSPRLDEMVDLFDSTMDDGFDVKVTPEGQIAKTTTREFDQSDWFKKVISEMRDDQGRSKGEVFVGTFEGKLAGLVTIFYKRWMNGLIAWVDLLGTAERFRGTGLETALLKRAVAATQTASEAHSLPAIGLVSEDFHGELSFAQKWEDAGGQVRTDIRYRIFDDGPGDTILWFPLDDNARDINSKCLAWALWRFPGLPEEGFRRLYGEPPHDDLSELG